MANVYKSFALPAVWTATSYKEGEVFNSDSSAVTLQVVDSPSKTGYAVFEWQFDDAVTSILGIGAANASTVVSTFYYKEATAGGTIYLDVVLLSSRPSTLSSKDLFEHIQGLTEVVATATPTGDKKNIYSVSLEAAALSALNDAFENNSFFAIAVRQGGNLGSQPTLDIGGRLLQCDPGEPWEDTSKAGGIPGPPMITVEYTADEVSHVVLDMRYTTADPTVSQSSPGSSLGGYVASNQVFARAQIGDYINSSQVTIPIASWSSLPTTTGAAQVGPEIIRYAGIDTTNHQLTGVTRGVAPDGAAFPASIDLYGEYVHYLDTSRLFNNTPTIELSQYRCVAIYNSIDSPIYDISVELYQNSSVATQVDVGIEVPLFSSRSGVINGAITSGSRILRTSEATVLNMSENFFANGHIIIDPGGTNFQAIIQSYMMEEGLATFTLSRTTPGFSDLTAFRISPAPAQRISTERTSPESNGRFFGWFSEDGAKVVSYGDILENGGLLNQYDAFYLWIKRTISMNTKASADIGAVIAIKYIQ